MNTDNKLIAEFMGCEFKKIGMKTLVSPTPTLVGTTYLEKLLYHSDWNWLMGVVSKIKTIVVELDKREEVDIHYYCEVSANEKRISYSFMYYDLTIDIVYAEVVKFIKWYTEQSK